MPRASPRFDALSSWTTAALGLLVAAACSSTSTGGVTGGGPVVGTEDAHCSGMATQAVSQADCSLKGDGGADDPGGSDYGDTMFNSEGDDDDCKYHVKWSSTPVGEGRDVTFTVIATTKSDGKPLGTSTGVAADANVYADVTLSDTHPAPPTDQSPTRRPRAPTRWARSASTRPATGRCGSTSTRPVRTSPTTRRTAHAAFYVQVP